MKNLRTPRFWLLTTAALIFGSATAVNAQTVRTYQAGAPTMVAAAPGLPSIPAEQIARDVTTEFNPRTGTRELIAAPFDPFEEDPTLAGSLRLRSADGAVGLDGRRLRDGALVEVDFYYNSPSDDPYGGRNYGDMAFVNGELAPVTLRDTRILECSTRVENVVYNHNTYYDRHLSSGIYRPYRHYAGHSGFGFGFGNSYFGPGYGAYGSRRSYGASGNRGVRGGYVGTGRRGVRADRNRDRSDRRRGRNEADDSVSGADQPRRPRSRRLTNRDIDERLSRVQSYGTGRTRAEVRRNARGVSPMRAGNPSARSQITTGAAPTPRRSSTSSQQAPQVDSGRTETRRAQPRRNNAQRSEITRAEPRRSQTRRSEPNRQNNARTNTRPKKTNSAPRRRISGGGTKNRIKNQIKKNFFPNDGYGGRGVVSSRSVDCAREDKLRVFVPNDRLDAARFDGLTLIALDAQGGETPIYLPPNYIEGFRLAATGRVRAQGVQSAPQYTAPQPIIPQYGAPIERTMIEPAPCPSGTTKQSNGTCLQIASTGYPYR